MSNDNDGLFSIVNYPKGTYGKLVLVKIKIMQAEFFENKPVTSTDSLADKIKSMVNHWFLAPTHRTYDFSK